MNVDEVVARMEINDCLLRYCRGVDRGDSGLLQSAYFSDGADDHGGGPLSPRVFADGSVARGDVSGMVGQHLITNVTIVLRGTRARVESYWLAIHPDPPGLAWAGGRYLDRFERRDGEWRIALRQVVCDWSRASEAPPSWPAAAVMPPGRRRGSDLSDGFLDFSDEAEASMVGVSENGRPV